jgi:simple sugar transport system permease protein
MNLSAIGENPSAADAAGIKIDLYKYVHILVGGALCGLGGAYLSVVQVPTWQENITAGRGWIAIALVIFSKWNPLKSIYGAYLFGGLSIIGFRIQYLNISQNLLNMLPYIVTIVVLVFSSLNKSKEGSPPKALSLPYFREER